MKPEIFVSYSRADQAQVFPIVEKLRERGLNIWIDQEGIHGAYSKLQNKRGLKLSHSLMPTIIGNIVFKNIEKSSVFRLFLTARLLCYFE